MNRSRRTSEEDSRDQNFKNCRKRNNGMMNDEKHEYVKNKEMRNDPTEMDTQPLDL